MSALTAQLQRSDDPERQQREHCKPIDEGIAPERQVPNH